MACHHVNLPGVGAAIICTSGPRKKPAACVGCEPGERLCDGTAARGKTCDASLCARCAFPEGKDKDLCPACAPPTFAFRPRSVADWEEYFAERAAIAEFQGGYPRAAAERVARRLAGPKLAGLARESSAVATLDRRETGRSRPVSDPAPGVRVSRWAGERADRDHDIELDNPRMDIGSFVRAEPPAPMPVPHSPPLLPGPSRCRSCMASIVFAGTLGGKIAPFERDDDGEWTINGNLARQVGKPGAQLELGAVTTGSPLRFTSHFARCPDAGTWRNSNPRTGP